MGFDFAKAKYTFICEIKKRFDKKILVKYH